MQILPITNQTNKLTFEAVIPKYLKRAEREYSQIKGITGDLLDCITYDVFFKQISKQDGIDTLQAIKKYADNAKGPWASTLKFIENINL